MERRVIVDLAGNRMSGWGFPRQAPRPPEMPEPNLVNVLFHFAEREVRKVVESDKLPAENTLRLQVNTATHPENRAPDALAVMPPPKEIRVRVQRAVGFK